MGIDWADAIYVESNDGNINDFLEEQKLTWENLKKLKAPKGAKYRCWRCADLHPIGGIEKCHIIAHQFGGKDRRSNFVLLCSLCHEEAPDLANDKQAIWEWIKATKQSFYGTFWSMRSMEEFERIYKRKPFDIPDLDPFAPIEAPNYEKVIKKFKALIKKEAGIHAFATTHKGIAPSTLAMLLHKAGA